MFTLTQEDHKKISEWLHGTVYPPILEQQRQDPSIAMWITKDKDGREWPYFGAIGGDLTYAFTPTGIGVITKVIHGSTGAELNLTDYDSW